MPFEDRTTNLDLNGPNIEIKTDAYGHEEGSTTEKTTVNPFGDDASRTGGVIEITGIGTASWPVGYSTYASNTGIIGYQWYRINTDGSSEALGISTRYEGQTTDTLKLKYLDNPGDNLKQYYVKTRILPSAYAQPEGATVTAGTARSTGFAINEDIDSGRVTITVLPELTLDTQPTNQSATVNNNAEFNTSASVTDYSTISYQWYVDGNQVSDGDLTSTNFASVTKEKYAEGESNGRDNSITIPEDATNVVIRVGAGAGGYGGTDTNGQGGAGGYGRVGYFNLPDGGRTLTIRTGQRGKVANSGNNAQGGAGGVVTDEGDGGKGGNAPNSGAGGGGASGCYVYDSLTSGWIIAAGGGGGGGGGSWNVGSNPGGNGGDWQAISGSLARNLTSNGAEGQFRGSSNTPITQVTFTVTRSNHEIANQDPNQQYGGGSFGADGWGYFLFNDGRLDTRDVQPLVQGQVSNGVSTYTLDIPFGTKAYFVIYGGPSGYVSSTRWTDDWRTMEWWANWAKLNPRTDAPNLTITSSTGRFYNSQHSRPGGPASDPREGYNYMPTGGWNTLWWEHDGGTVIRTDGGGGGGGGGGYIGGAGGNAGIDNPPPPPPPPPPEPRRGCTDSSAKNYDRHAEVNDGSCVYPQGGCRDLRANNFSILAEFDDGSCTYDPIRGCMDRNANNYVWNANEDDGSCTYPPKIVRGCTDSGANNYNSSANEDDGSCTYPAPAEDDDDEDGCFVGTTRVVMRSPTIILSDNSPTEETKPISEVKVGDYVMNKDKTEANKVVFVEKKSASDKELYAPFPDEKPFATKNHMLYVDGKWVNADGNVYPWLDDCKKLTSNRPDAIEPAGDQVVYNLWVTGDGSYIVNGYGTHSIMFDGGFMRNAHDQGLLAYDDVLSLMEEFTEQKPDLLYGSFLVNRLLGKVNVKLLNRLWVNILCAEDSTKRKKVAHLTMRILQKMGGLFKND